MEKKREKLTLTPTMRQCTYSLIRWLPIDRPFAWRSSVEADTRSTHLQQEQTGILIQLGLIVPVQWCFTYERLRRILVRDRD
ncbi:hypothetical protein EV363DRAFT_1157175 [Boletus edulis]|uniref:Uncharacterized protein n=1 Tax=Boletus edulis BED1 TaxID=1328754 RepID=A0AAD4BT79_BOLED|nr:hypothetical protein EV363DRAFT_1157175 [Boletus edulis]KAF8438981.1 hypothetical protein L210DRAFT_60327 [Boletus edulis BED1]